LSYTLRRVTSFVTKGLPSRSPPIHEPNWKKRRHPEPSVGIGLPQRAVELVHQVGDDVEQFSVTKYSPQASSWATVGFSSRSSPVSQSSSISVRTASIRPLRSRGVQRGASRSTSRR